MTEFGKWQTIETAPKDGKPFLVAVPVFDGGSGILRAKWCDLDNKIVDATYDPFADQCDEATHWMPLPEPPHD